MAKFGRDIGGAWQVGLSPWDCMAQVKKTLYRANTGVGR